MTLTSYVTDLIRADFAGLVRNALAKGGMEQPQISHWCIHPGGKRILQAIEKGLSLTPDDLCPSYTILRDYGNMSSATILFVLAEMWPRAVKDTGAHIFAAAFGPGLTMESVILTVA